MFRSISLTKLKKYLVLNQSAANQAFYWLVLYGLLSQFITPLNTLLVIALGVCLEEMLRLYAVANIRIKCVITALLAPILLAYVHSCISM